MQQESYDPDDAQPPAQQTFHLHNWPPYGQTPPRRGVLVVWFDEVIARARMQPQRTGRRGRPYIHDTAALQCMLILQEFYQLPLRQAQMLMAGVIKLAQSSLRVPNYSTLSRRRAALVIQLPEHDERQPLHLVLDPVGLRVYTEVDWFAYVQTLMESHTWRRVRIEVHEATHQIVALLIDQFHAGKRNEAGRDADP